MYNKNHGHGICGSKNIYNSKVRIDNWVEDNFGMQIASQRRDPVKLYTTVTKADHCHPSQWPDPPATNTRIPSTHELKSKNKDGLAYDLLFQHGVDPEKDNEVSLQITICNGSHQSCFCLQDRFKTVNTMTIMSKPPNMTTNEHNTNDNPLWRKKSRQKLEDINQSLFKTTESRYASSHLSFNPSFNQPNESAKTSDIPNFRRQLLITKH
jgi:hypothetical protein